jgi:membrane associated rhomboid family serine protease
LNYQNDQYQPNSQFSVFPTAVKNLLIINALVFIGLNIPGLGNFLYQLGALWPLDSGKFEIWQPVSYLFLHAGFAHIFFNLFALWMFGQAIENYWGSKRFTIYYFITGIGAAIIQLIFVNANVPTVGASGAVYGILLAFGMMFPNRYIVLLIPPIPIKAKYFVAIFGGIELMNGVLGTQAGVANFAHLGGMLFGYALIKFWGLKRRG